VGIETYNGVGTVGDQDIMSAVVFRSHVLLYVVATTHLKSVTDIGVCRNPVAI
jgi:hypothetical protein